MQGEICISISTTQESICSVFHWNPGVSQKHIKRPLTASCLLALFERPRPRVNTNSAILSTLWWLHVIVDMDLTCGCWCHFIRKFTHLKITTRDQSWSDLCYDSTRQCCFPAFSSAETAMGPWKGSGGGARSLVAALPQAQSGLGPQNNF